MANNTLLSSAGTGMTFGPAQENEFIVEAYSRDVSVKKVTVVSNGSTIAIGHGDPEAAIKIDGYFTGDTSLAVATALTLVNDTSSHGLSGGTVFCDSIGTNSAEGAFTKISVSCTQYKETLS